MPDLRDKIWLTAHTRMISEARLTKNARLWNLLIVWYSTSLACLTTYQLVADESTTRNILSAILAIGVLSLSIYIPTLQFEQKAALYRSCYLRLQRLLDLGMKEIDLATQYHDVLENFPNHSNRDWNKLLVNSHCSGRALQDGETNIPVPKMMIFGNFLIQTRDVILWLTAFAMPAILSYFLLF
jgi:hypothetical protein